MPVWQTQTQRILKIFWAGFFYSNFSCPFVVDSKSALSMCTFMSGRTSDINSFYWFCDVSSQVVGWVGSSIILGESLQFTHPVSLPPCFTFLPCAGNQTSSKLMSVTPLLWKNICWILWPCLALNFNGQNCIEVTGLIFNVSIVTFTIRLLVLRLRRRGVSRFYSSCAVCCVRFGMAWIRKHGM